MRIQCWVDGMFLCAPLGEMPHREFFGAYDPLPVELKNEKSLWRTNVDLFYSVEYRGSWDESAIETMIRETAESEYGHFFTYLKIVPEIISEIAPPRFSRQKTSFHGIHGSSRP